MASWTIPKHPHIVHSFSPPLFNPLSCFPLLESGTWMCNSVPGCLATWSGVPEPRDPLVQSRRNVTLSSSASVSDQWWQQVVFSFYPVTNHVDVLVRVINRHLGELFLGWSSAQVPATLCHAWTPSRWQTLIICFAQSGHELYERITHGGKNLPYFNFIVSLVDVYVLVYWHICLLN